MAKKRSTKKRGGKKTPKAGNPKPAATAAAAGTTTTAAPSKPAKAVIGKVTTEEAVMGATRRWLAKVETRRELSAIRAEAQDAEKDAKKEELEAQKALENLMHEVSDPEQLDFNSERPDGATALTSAGDVPAPSSSNDQPASEPEPEDGATDDGAAEGEGEPEAPEASGGDQSWKPTSLSTLNIGVGGVSSLREAAISTLGDLIGQLEAGTDLTHIKGIGPKAVGQVKAAVLEYFQRRPHLRVPAILTGA